MVMDRMEEAFRMLSRLPIHTRPKGYINSMPVYLYDRADLNSQLETHELERLARMCNRPYPAIAGRDRTHGRGAAHPPMRVKPTARLQSPLDKSLGQRQRKNALKPLRVRPSAHAFASLFSDA